ncbi:MAG: site-2 protease family protein [Phycisphaerae bacterium]|nr:site-2 protease family protein [Phycisphaerae bacterium]NUQ46424.1 site-2 protease family protein [Phycisphaerae bacterium]
MLSSLTLGSPALLAEIDLAGWLRSGWALLQVIIGFSLVVFVHELGHFLAAKWAGVRVEKFCIGFGKELFGFTRGDTRYGFNLLPLGGYVKMLGQEDFAVDKSGELRVKDQEGSFTSKSVGQRMVIVSAGVVMNLIFAAIGLTIYMMVGYETQPAVVGLVAPNTPAARAGLQTGDHIIAINDDAIREFNDLKMRVVLSDPGEVLDFKVLREGKELNIKLVPEFQEKVAVRQVGMSPGWTRRVAGLAAPASAQLGEDELRPNDFLLSVLRNGQFDKIERLEDLVNVMIEARGMPVQFKVNRPTQQLALEKMVHPDESAAEGAPRETLVTARAGWYVHEEITDKPDSASLLGLVPRRRAGFPEEGSPADLAGLEPFDVIVRANGMAHPNAEELERLVADNAGRSLELLVRRPRSPNGPLSADGVRFVSRWRESWIEAAAHGLEPVRAMVAADLEAAGLPADDISAVRLKSASLSTLEEWIDWLEGVDLHRISIEPRKPFSFFGGSKPTIGVKFESLEDDLPVVGDVASRIDDHASPAANARVPRGAVIVAVDDEAVSDWPHLTEALRTRAGQTVRLRYRLDAVHRETAFDVPACVSTSLSIPATSRIERIAGRDRVEAVTPSGRPATLFLPDWRAVRALLKEHIGRSVPVAWRDVGGESHEAEFAVTAHNYDPWMARVAFHPQFFCYPMLIRIHETNPLMATWAGIRKTYYATLNTVQSIRHIAFTRQVGVSQLKGPVGIARIGMQVAEANWTQLLWFLCLISANLAVINFLPLPIVDGGLFFFLLLEKIRGEPLSIKTQVATQVLGIALIASLFLFVTFQDIVNWNK